MSFIQCKDRDECEDKVGKSGGFVTNDHRIYDEIEFWDDDCCYEFSPGTALALYNLQCEIERMGEDLGSEMSFNSVVQYATDLRKAYRGVLKQLKIKPLRKVK